MVISYLFKLFQVNKLSKDKNPILNQPHGKGNLFYLLMLVTLMKGI